MPPTRRRRGDRGDIALVVVAAAAAASFQAAPASASACSSFANQCSLCIAEKSFFGSCFYCPSDGSCHDFGSLEYPSGCSNSGCMSSSSFTSCSGSCSTEKDNVVAGFNVPTAQCLAAVSLAAYQGESSDPSLVSMLNAAGLTHYETLSASDTFGVVVAHPSANAVVVGFRGTDVTDVSNFLTDIDITLKDFASEIDSSYAAAASGWKVCDGFSKAYMTLRAQTLAAIDWASGLVGGTPTLYFTGHSLGASMAELAAADVYLSGRANDFDSVHMYTFAAPRTGNPAFALGLAALGPEVWSVQNYYDVIPHLPTQSSGYQHVQNIAVVGPKNGEVVEVTPAEDAEHTDVLDLNPIDFHHLTAYQSLLDSLAGADTGTVCAAANL